MVASPQDLDPLDVEHEKRLVEQALRTLRASRLVELSWLEGQTWEDLQQAMWGGPWHIFHFIGHGVFDQASDEGCIALSNEENRSRLLGARNLARLLDGHYPLRLVLLNSCEGARGSARDAFSGAAATLVRRGIPAVVAMQYEITDEAAIAFARTFYRAVANDLPVDASVAAGRTAISMDNALEWGTPVLYMRSPDGRIFDISTEALSAGPGREQPEDREEEERRNRLEELYTQARSLHRDQEWQRVVDVFDEINVLDPAYPDPEGLLALARAELAAVEQEQTVAALYNQGLRHMETEEWSKALEFFEEIQRLEPGYQDTERLLSQARQEEERRKRLDELEAKAHRLHRDREWQQVVETFDQMHVLDPEHADPEGLLASAREALERAQKEQDALHRYREGVESAWAEEALDRGEAERLRELKKRLELSLSAAGNIEREVMGDTLEATLGHQERAAREEKRRNRLEELYTQARQLHQAQEWQAVVDVFDRIHSLDSEYPDPEGFLESAHEQLAAREELTRRVAAIYDQGRRHIESEEWSQALECFREVQRLKPAYRDTEMLLSQVRDKLAKPQTLEVPDLSGQNAFQMRSILEDRGLKLGTQRKVSSDTVPEGEIVRQTPEAGTEVEASSSVDITISKGPSTVEVPDLAGQSASEASSTLADAGLKLGSQNETSSETVPEGEIVGHYPSAKAKTKRGRSVNITVSSGPQKVTVPGLTKCTLPQAEEALASAGLSLGEQEEVYSDAVPGGEIITQSPEGGAQTKRHSSVSVTVSLGPRERATTTTAPDFGPKRRDRQKQKEVLGAAAAVFAGVAWLASGALSVLGITYTGLGLLPGTILIIATIGTLGGLVGLHARQATSYGRLGVTGFLAAFVGTTIVLVGLLALSAFPPLWKLGFAGIDVGFVLLGVGLVLLRIANLRARALPRGYSLLLIVGAFGLFGYVVPGIGSFVSGLVLGLIWLALGYFLWSQSGITPGYRLRPEQVEPSLSRSEHQGVSWRFKVVMAAIFSALGIFGSILWTEGATPHPDLRGKTISEAAKITGPITTLYFQPSGLTLVGERQVDVGREEANKVRASVQPKGTIVDQSPAANWRTFEHNGRLISVTLSGGQESVKVPDVSSLSKSQATRVLIDAGLEPLLSAEFDRSGNPVAQSGPDETITGTRPSAGEVVNPGADIILRT